MYYTTSGAYRKTKMFIDYANIVLTFAIVIMFVFIMFMRDKSGIIFPIIFFAGTLQNAFGAAKLFIDKQKVRGGVLAGVAVVMLVMALLCLMAVL